MSDGPHSQGAGGTSFCIPCLVVLAGIAGGILGGTRFGWVGALSGVVVGVIGGMTIVAILAGLAFLASRRS